MNDVIYQRNAQTDTSTVGNRVIVFERASKSAIVLNPTGAQIWQLLSTPQSVAQMGAALQTQFPSVEAVQLHSDVENYLKELVEQKLVLPA